MSGSIRLRSTARGVAPIAARSLRVTATAFRPIVRGAVHARRKLHVPLSVRGKILALQYAWQGIAYMLRTQPNACSRSGYGWS